MKRKMGQTEYGTEAVIDKAKTFHFVFSSVVDFQLWFYCLFMFLLHLCILLNDDDDDDDDDDGDTSSAEQARRLLETQCALLTVMNECKNA